MQLDLQNQKKISEALGSSDKVVINKVEKTLSTVPARDLAISRVVHTSDF